MAKRKAAAVENQSGRSALDAIDLCSSQESDEDAEPLQRASDETDGTTTSLASAVKDDAKASSPKKRRHHNGAANNDSAVATSTSRQSHITPRSRLALRRCAVAY